jgi:hypothetical protein
MEHPITEPNRESVTEESLQLTSANEPASRLRAHALNLAIIAGALVVMFWRVFFLGETLIDVRTLNNQLPWGYSAGATDYPYNRRDLTDMYVTRDYFVAGAYRDGELPLWNPYTMSGHPIYADGVTRTFSPFLIFYKFMSVPRGYSLARIVELFFGALFMYIFLIGIRVSPRGALFGALVFEFSAHSMLHLTGLGWWGGLMWLPLIMLFVGRATRAGGYRSAAIAGLFLAAQFFCGYLPNQIYYVAAILVCYAVRVRGWHIRAVVDTAGKAFTTLAIGFAVGASQWAPVFELLRYSNRLIVPTQMGYIYLPPWYAATLVFPNLFGSAYDEKSATLFSALNVSHDHVLYLGIAALLPAALAVRSAWKRNESGDSRLRVFLVLALVALVAMMAAPLYVHVTRFLPVLQTIRVIVRAGVLFVFAAAVLAGAGLDILLRTEADRFRAISARWGRLLVATLLCVSAAVALSYVAVWTGFANEAAGRGRVAFMRKSAALLSRQFGPPDLAIVVPLLMMFAVSVVIRLTAMGRVSRRMLFAGLCALLLIDLFWNSLQFNPSFSSSQVFPRTRVTETIKSLPPGRVLVTPADLDLNRSEMAGKEKIVAPPNTLLAYQIPAVTGKDQLYPRWYREYAALVEPQPYLSHVVFDETHSPFLDMLNARYVLTRESAPPPPQSRLVVIAEGLALYENVCARPRALLVKQGYEATGAPLDDAIAVLGNTATGVSGSVVLEHGTSRKRDGIQPARASDLCYQADLAGSAEIVGEKRNRVTISTSSQTDGILVLSDTYYPGWTADVDGQPVEILRANHTMRAVRVPAGNHMVSFEFAPKSFWIPLYISVGACAGVVIAIVAMSFLRRRTRAGKRLNDGPGVE